MVSLKRSSPATFERPRQRMIARLQERGIQHPEVLEAMNRIPRHLFVDPALELRAYDDDALPLGHGQTISQPHTVARMSERLITDLAPHTGRQKVLEIGTGCGYQTAILAQLFQEVYTIERIGALHERARQTLRQLNVHNARLVHGDGQIGLPEAAPYDAVLIAAAAQDIPQTLIDQLTPNGRIILPIAESQQQYLWLIEKHGEHIQHTRLDPVRFVPLLHGRQ